MEMYRGLETTYSKGIVLEVVVKELEKCVRSIMYFRGVGGGVNNNNIKVLLDTIIEINSIYNTHQSKFL